MAKRRGPPPKNVNRHDESYYKRPKKTKEKRFYQGKFEPKNPEKYRGDVTNITFRSSWELKFMIQIDKDPSVLAWNSEGTVIPYYSEVDQKMRRYFIDFYLVIMGADGKPCEYLVEVKPEVQIYPPKKPKGKLTEKRQINYANASATYMVNQNKWRATVNFIDRQPITFLLTYLDSKTNKFVFLPATEILTM